MNFNDFNIGDLYVINTTNIIFLVLHKDFGATSRPEQLKIFDLTKNKIRWIDNTFYLFDDITIIES